MQILHMLVPLRTPFVEQLFGAVTRLGEETAAILVICTLFWCVSKRLGYGVGISFFLSGLLVQGLKIGFRVDRPWIRDPGFQPAASAIEKATGYSFPSGHTQTATSIFVSLAIGLKRWRWRIPLLFIPVLVAVSRMVLGVHTPQDVLVSLVLATLISIVVMTVVEKREGEIDVTQPALRKPMSGEWLVSGIIAVCSIGLMFFASWLYRAALMDTHYLADSFKIAGSGIGFALGYFLERRFVRFSTHTRKWWMQPVKVMIGVGILLGLQQGLKLVLGAGAGANALRYCLMILWALAVWPLLFKRLFPAP